VTVFNSSIVEGEANSALTVHDDRRAVSVVEHQMVSELVRMVFYVCSVELLRTTWVTRRMSSWMQEFVRRILLLIVWFTCRQFTRKALRSCGVS